MRLGVIDNGADLPTRLTLGLIRRVTRVQVADVIRASAYRHRFFGTPFHAVVQRVLRGPSEWTEGERELIAAFTSELNTCPFCISCHREFAGRKLDEAPGGLALADLLDADLGPRLSAVLILLDKLARTPELVTPEDVEQVRGAGVSEQALEDAVTISVTFHVINRVMNALGAEALEGRELQVVATIVGRAGYVLPPTIRFLSRAR